MGVIWKKGESGRGLGSGLPGPPFLTGTDAGA